MDWDKRLLENISPKQEALLRRSRRALHQAGYIWRKAAKYTIHRNGAGSAECFADMLGLRIVATMQSII